MKSFTLGLDDIGVVAEYIVDNFTNGVVVLQGDLATGKTTLVKEVVKKFAIDDDVTSPTFSLEHCYADRVYHYDIYNHGIEHFISLGMLEELDKEGLHFIEWGDDSLIEILHSAAIETLVIQIQKISQNQRRYNIEQQREQ